MNLSDLARARALRTLLLAAFLTGFWANESLGAAKGIRFVAPPYVQLGNKIDATESDKTSEEILWLTQEGEKKWSVEYRVKGDDKWREAPVRAQQMLSSHTKPLFTCQATLANLHPGKTFEYRVKQDSLVGFAAVSTARKNETQPYRFVVMGDLGANTVGQKEVAYQCFKRKPDFVVIPGDIAYDFGLLSEYLVKFFPIYNSDESTPQSGAPLMRSVPFIPVLGNHDIGLGAGWPTDFNRLKDALAYFLVWSEPLNGPLKKAAAEYTPKLKGEESRVQPFLTSAGDKYPQMANYSFDYGNSHWLVLDANPYMDWTNSTLRAWVEDDLKSARAKWKFVTFHQPGFSRDPHHALEQRMRVLSDIFQEQQVDIVFSGHAHNYQRSYPMTFKPKGNEHALVMNTDGTVSGIMNFDKVFDGKKETTPRGVIYIVTGAGGARLYGAGPNQALAEQDFVSTYKDEVHSFTVCDINDARLSIKQISADGAVLDQFAITK